MLLRTSARSHESAGMEKVLNRSELIVQIVAVRHEQDESNDRATYVGWTPEKLADHDNRSKLIATLTAQLRKSAGQ
jgi:hypothetical protein